MDAILQGIPSVICYLDDLLIMGTSDQEHLWHLQQVLTRLTEQGIKLKKEKCSFLQNSVEYLGFSIKEYTPNLPKYKMPLTLRMLVSFDHY